MINTDIITGMFPIEEKQRCAKYLKDKYQDFEVLFVHMTPINKRIKVEVIKTDGGKIYHYLRKKECGNFEEVDLPMNDR